MIVAAILDNVRRHLINSKTTGNYDCVGYLYYFVSAWCGIIFVSSRLLLFFVY